MAWGGSRHKSKPHVDAGLLWKELDKHVHFLKDLGIYETASRNTSPDPAGLVKILPLIAGLITLEPSCEVHGSSLRQALATLLTNKPEVNTSEYNGKVWANLRCERITTILNHMRNFKREEAQLKAAVFALTPQQLQELKAVVNQIQHSDCKKQQAPAALPIADVVETSLETAADPFTRKLKAQPSACSVDSDGYPNMLNSPQKTPEEASDGQRRSFLRKRLKVSAGASSATSWSMGDANLELKGSLGYEACKKPATSLKKSAPLSKESVPADVGDSSRNPWFQLKKTVGKNPAKAYICGNHAAGEKVKLIVEVTEKRSSQYLHIIDHIMKELKLKHLTKNEALEMRSDLCLKYP